MSERREEGLNALYARLSDLCGRAERGEMAVSAFLSPAELHFAENYLKTCGARFGSYGGYADAERKRVLVLPDYMEDARIPEDLETYGESPRISALQITGSGYVTLSHRDFLGALLGLGLERSVVGDIHLTDGAQGAYVWVEESIAPFVCSELRSVGRDTVKVKEVTLPDGFSPVRKTIPIRDTVASPRLDAVVASLCSLSREQARETVERGLVELNYESEERGDRTVTAPAVISVRGHGKFRVTSLSELTKKGRLRLVAEKYV